MRISVYYFSGTGNSLAVARDIAGRIKGKLIAIPAVINTDMIGDDAEIIGIVFPVYNQGIPYIIQRFVQKMESISNTYLFGICTFANSPGLCLEYLNRHIAKKGGRLSAGFAVKMPYNYVNPSFVVKNFFGSFQLRETSPERQQRLFAQWKSRLAEVCDNIVNRKEGPIETKSRVIESIVDFLHLRESLQKYCWLKIGGFEGKTDLPFTESIQLFDHAFRVDSHCIGCGICKQVCPVNNIEIVNGSPRWQHKCEQCFACLHWCPKNAIQFSRKTSGQKRYHHPDVKLSDIINNKPE